MRGWSKKSMRLPRFGACWQATGVDASVVCITAAVTFVIADVGSGWVLRIASARGSRSLGIWPWS